MFAGMSVAYWFLPLEILYFNLSLRPPALILTMSVLNALSLKQEKKRNLVSQMAFAVFQQREAIQSS